MDLKKLVIFQITFILMIHLSETSVLTQPKKNFLYDINDKKNFTDIDYTQIILVNQISFLEQSRLLRDKLKLECNQYNTSKIIAKNLTKYVVTYLLNYENNEEKITGLASLLLGPLGEYGAKKEEKISHAQKMTVIRNWLRHSILGMPFHDWILNEVRLLKKEGNNSLLTHHHVMHRLLEQLLNKTKTDELSSEAMNYYLDNILIEDMPTFQLNTFDEQELERLQLINLSEPEFGYLYVGLKVLIENEIIPQEVWRLDDIEDIGVLIESLIREGNITNIELFELPAKIYYMSTLDDNAPPRKIWGSFYEEYFSYLQQSNPFVQLMEPLNNWKNRSTLARQVLKENDVSEYYLDGYLYRGDYSDFSYPNSRDNQVPLPSIDDIFDNQNRNVSNSFKELDKISLFSVFNNLDKKTQNFIQAAEISLVQAVFRGEFIYTNVALLRYPGFDRAQLLPPPMYLETDNIDLLLCKTNFEERIYVLDTRKYELHRVDREKNKYCNFYKCKYEISNYNLYLEIKEQIKAKEVSTEILIEKLSKMHGDKLYKILKNIGYEATGLQKFEDFLLSLIPFYTCIGELKEGNYRNAVLPCAIDFVSLAPFFGKGIYIAYKFGAESAVASIHAVRLAAKQASMYQLLLRAGKNFVDNGISQVQKTINSRIFKELGREFLRGVDPGIGLLSLSGTKFIQAMKKASEYLKKGYPKLDKLTEKLVTKSEKEVSRASLIPAHVLKSKEILILPDLGQEAAVVKIGEEYGYDVLVQIDETEKYMFGQKYVRDPTTNEIDLAPVFSEEQSYRLKIEGLAESGIVKSGRQIAKWEEAIIPLESSAPVSEVFRADTRVLDEIQKAGGCWPHEASRYDYNMEQHHTYFENQYSGIATEWASPFVSTSSSLETVRKYLKAISMKTRAELRAMGILHQSPDDIIGYVYRVRPGENFYNKRQSYLAARDVCVPDSPRYALMNNIVKKWGGMKEYLALDGFSSDRIIEYAAIRRRDDGVSELQWIPNSSYNADFNSHVSSSDIYTRVSVYKPADAVYMGVNMIQRILGVSKVEAKSIVIRHKLGDHLMDWVTKYNLKKEELLSQIQKFSSDSK